MLHLFGGSDTAGQVPSQSHFPWKFMGLVVWAAVLAFLALNAVTDTFFGSAQVEPRQITEEVVKTAPKINPPSLTESSMVDPILSTIEWVEVGTARNEREVLDLSIHWDRLGTYHLPPQWDLVANLPPATDMSRPGGPIREVIGAYLEGNMVIVYMYTDNHPNKADASILSYWKAKLKLSEVEGLRP